MVKRLNAAERAGFRRYGTEMGLYRLPEPALGTVEERLDIIIRRQGGRVGPVRLTPAERAELASYQMEELIAA